MTVLENLPMEVKETYLNMKKDYGKKLELKVIDGKYYLYIAKDVWDKSKKKPVKKTVLLGSIDTDGTFRKKRPKRIFSSSMVYEYGRDRAFDDTTAMSAGAVPRSRGETVVTEG